MLSSSVLLRLCALAGIMIAAFPADGLASQKKTSIKLSSGTRVQYAVVLPDELEPGRKYPTILSFPGGAQGIGMVLSDFRHIWRNQAEQRGYIVVSPSVSRSRLERRATTARQLFFERKPEFFHEFIDQMIERYPIDPDQMHIAGFSNGGISAFHVASLMPERFKTIVTLPGFLRHPDGQKYSALLPLCIIMFAGENDRNWVLNLEREQKVFQAVGKTIFAEVIPNGGHVPRALMGPGSARLFDLIESGAGC